MHNKLFLYFLVCGLLITAVPVHAQLIMPSTSNAGVQAQVAALFADAPDMSAVAKCESGFRQFTSSGAPLAGGTGGNYIGVFQISSGHAAEALSMGMDIYTVDGNLAYARFLYQKQGTAPWFDCAPRVPVAPATFTPPTTPIVVPAVALIDSSSSTTSVAVAVVASTTIPSTNLTPVAIPEKNLLTQNLNFGMTNSQVVILQQLLNLEGFTLAPSGPGSPGNETNRFGDLTRQAVQRFQCQKNITCSGNESTTGYGRVGPMTRAVLLATP